MLSDDAAVVAEWRTALAVCDPPVRVRGIDEPEAQGAVAALLDGPSGGRLTNWPGIKLLFGLNAGVEDLLDDPALQGRSLVRMVCPEAITLMTEYVCHYVTQSSGRFAGFARAQQEHHWAPSPPGDGPYGRRVGVMGLGRFGLPVARALVALGYQVSGWSRTARVVEGIKCLTGSTGLDEMVAETDVLICVLPLTAATRGLLGRERLRKLPAGASLINVGRGACLVEADLLEVLDEGHLTHATLDVFEHEPLPADNPLWRHPRVAITPHVAANISTAASARVLARTLAAALGGEEVLGLVDPMRGY